MNKERVIEIMNELFKVIEMNPNQLADSLDMKRTQGIYDILNPDKKVGISKNMADKICSKFPNIKKSYLLTGEGSIINEEDPERKEKEISISPSDIKEGEYSGALVYNIDGTCGIAEREMAFTRDNIVGSVNLPEINKESKIIRANGDSMEPVIFDGDRVVIRQIFNFDEIFYGQIYLILLEEYRMIKYIRRYEPDEENYVILRSRNKEYDDIKLHKSKIKKLFVVENILSVKSQL